MICPRCGADRPLTVDSRQIGETVRRRRECRACGQRWPTVEMIEWDIPEPIRRKYSVRIRARKV